MVLVTGGTGFIGRGLVTALRRAHSTVRVISRSPAPSSPTDGVEFVRGDVLEPSTIMRALCGVDAVVHLAAQRDADGTSSVRVNVEGTRNLVESVRRQGVATFVHVSSDAVYGLHDSHRPKIETDPAVPSSEYGASKLEAERVVATALAGTITRWVVLRPTSVFGPGRQSDCDFYRRIMRRRLWVHAGPTTVVQPVFIDDVVDAIVSALTRTGVNEAIINIAGRQALSYAEWLDTIARIAGRRLRQVQLPHGPTRIAGRIAAALYGIAGAAPPYRIARLTWRADHRALDISRARRLLDYAPSSLDQALTMAIEACGIKGAGQEVIAR